MENLRSKLLLVFLALLLAGSGAFGLVMGLRGTGRAASFWATAVAWSDLGFGVAGLSAAALLLLRRASALWVIGAWGVFATFSSALAPVILEGRPVLSGVAGGAVTAFLAAAVLWASSDFTTRGGSS